MNEPTLADAHAVIEKTKAARPMCSECSVFDIRACWHVASGQHPPLDEDFIQSALEACVTAQLRPLGWAVTHYGGAYVKRCEKCAAAPEFPWAARLDAEKVLAFMKAQPADSAFWLGALEKTL